MIVKSLELDFFRNYVHLEAVFDPRVNLIYGDNAQGKTNLLEAVAYLSTARSHRARYDREMIMLGVDGAFVKGEVRSRARDFTLEARLNRGARRRFLDSAICQLRPRYEQALSEYNRLYDHKVRILRDWQENLSLLSTLDDFNLRMAQTGALIVHYRAHFIRRLQESAPAIHRDFSGGKEELSLRYETVSTVTDPLAGAKTILPQLLEHQQAHRQAELDSRQCLSGPHKDDLAVEIDGNPAKTYGSQGQTRTAALSLKLAQREIFFQETGEWPVLLLDDVLSELDHRRQAFVLNRIQGGQVFISCCEEEKLEGLENGKSFHIQGGRLGSGA